ncbi:alpha/beta hydrolase family protein [Hufsiella ginkgonis]|uniref:Acetylxylan esterase n=1 Tax=Hufsiella ginkgonis TaxID=2695274 RepID=A0A7K1XW16_9SPHI|nr:acetylxylan esterase [Hufsiella ginkgonis]MXV15160.1 acetylxylan esterase [Hufsiella ginkgonis]
MTLITAPRNAVFALLLLSSPVLARQQTPSQQVTRRAPAAEVAGIPVNYDDAKAGAYTLPDVLTLKNGKKVTDAKTWTNKRRPELIALYETEQFGKAPAKPAALRWEVFDKGTPALNGTAIRRQVTLYFDQDTSKHKVELLIYFPVGASKPSPLFMEVNFSANSAAVNDPGIKPSLSWSKEGKRVPVAARPGFGRLAVDKFLSEGFAVATVCYTDLEPDALNAATWGIRGKYLKAGETKPAPDEWGAIAAWSWGISCIMDYLVTDKQVDAKRVAIHGSSRLGKTALWAGAKDPRIALVIASASGEGGAALSRRNYGETIAHMVAPTRYDYQFAGNRAKYAADPATSPIDAHMLVALMAPRPVLLQTGDDDGWSDPKGEFLAAVAAEPVFKLFGKTGPGTTIMPPPADQSLLLNTLGYYEHIGGHGPIPADWGLFVTYLKKFL